MSYLRGIDAIYWINLNKSEDRRISMELCFTDTIFENIPKFRIEGIDGETEDVMSYFVENRPNPKETKIEYAVLASHLKAIQTFSESNFNVAIIFEDDLSLDFIPFCKKTVEEIIQNAPSDWEIIQLSYIVNKNIPLDEYATPQWSALSYIINKNASIKLMKLYNNNRWEISKYPYKRPSDHFIFSFLKTYCYKYPIFIYRDNNDSLIHPSHLAVHIRSKQLLLELVKNNHA